MQRRTFLTHSLGMAAVTAAPTDRESGAVKRLPGTRLRIALNAYSFNRPLAAGKLTLDDLVDYCARHGIEGLDATGYYFPGYPKVPADDYIFRLKRWAFTNGVTISGTGVRNDFALPNASERRVQIQLVKDW
ncbi:MAG TPA: sugar phosphate isomerase/epimerase, partial [Bryobacteraceae bacterium]|nr:sugar phosphate isomerase/epimerase [Bryobacteraceae bacterium]